MPDSKDYFISRLTAAAAKKKVKYNRTLSGYHNGPQRSWQKDLTEAVRKKIVKLTPHQVIVEAAIHGKSYSVFETKSYNEFWRTWNDEINADRTARYTEAQEKNQAIDDEVQRISDLVVFGKSSDLGDLLKAFLAKDF